VDSNTIRSSLVSGQYRVTFHARQRMGERMISDTDINHCAFVASEIRIQGNGKFKVVGTDLDGEELIIICAWDGETIIITLF
jgi:hypothetical protein